MLYLLQEAVFSDTENLIQSAFDGFNVSIFAYGQTGELNEFKFVSSRVRALTASFAGSGKTFTMVGAPGAPGACRGCLRCEIGGEAL
jgi:hypothetical protein